jgi:uncharacterized membrane protein
MKREPIDLEKIISGELRWGVALSLILLGVGSALFLLHPGGASRGGGSVCDLSQVLQRCPMDHYTWSWFANGLAQWHGDVFVIPGLALLIATPVLRVAVSIFAFALEKDRIYVGITTLVLALLILSFLLGKAA